MKTGSIIEVHRTAGLEHPLNSHENQHISKSTGRNSGRIDAMFETLRQLWPTLPSEARSLILGIAMAATRQVDKQESAVADQSNSFDISFTVNSERPKNKKIIRFYV